MLHVVVYYRSPLYNLATTTTYTHTHTVLSQLESLAGDITAVAILLPVISAVAFLLIGGYIALYVIPGAIEKYIHPKVDHEYHGKVELTIMFGFLLMLMPATHYAKASYLMGAFIAGLSFCTSHELHEVFIIQFKRIMQWLMRIFFAASIGFQVPIKDFANGTVVWQGLAFTLALVGKLAVGFMVPNFTQSKKFTGLHLRDCLITGFSMAAEGEFAFVIAVFAVDEGLIDKDLYASVVLAVLLSTIFPPFLLKFTIGYYNRQAAANVRKIANDEMERHHNLEDDSEPTKEEREARLEGDIKNNRAVFLCIQTQSEASWGLLHKMMATLSKLGLDVIDHRSWHPRGINTTLINEIYCKDKISIPNKGASQAILDARMLEIQEALDKAINQPKSAKAKVQRWYPGVVEEITESVDEKHKKTGKRTLNLEQRLLREASVQLDRKQNLTIAATQGRTVEEILSGMNAEQPLQKVEEGMAMRVAAAPKQARRRRQKMRSTPVVGGGLFDEGEKSEEKEERQDFAGSDASNWKTDFGFERKGQQKAEIIVNGESYNIRINNDTLKSLRSGFSGDMLDSRGLSKSSGMSLAPDSSQVVNMLQGYVRSAPPMSKIAEESIHDGESETSSVTHGGPTHDNDLSPV
jgi:hypothetical protein